jgi:hypothetical protein
MVVATAANRINNDNGAKPLAKPTSAKHYGGDGGSDNPINNDNGATALAIDNDCGGSGGSAKLINNFNGVMHIVNFYGGGGGTSASPKLTSAEQIDNG